MPTHNIDITTAWTKLADDTDGVVLITSASSGAVEVATVATDTSPVVNGHLLSAISRDQGISRDLLGSGFIFARVVAWVPSAQIVVTK